MFSMNRFCQSIEAVGMVRIHRSHRARSTGFCGSGGDPAPAIGMNSGSLSRYALAPSMSRVRL